MRTTIIVAAVALLGAAGCSKYESQAQPVSSIGASRNAQPESANSLPPGSAVNAPVLAPGSGLRTTRVP